MKELVFAYLNNVKTQRGSGYQYLIDRNPSLTKTVSSHGEICRALAFIRHDATATTDEAYSETRMILDGEMVMPIIIDIDYEGDLQKSLEATNKISKAMTANGMQYGKHYRIDFSGNKGFHFFTAAQPLPAKYDKREVERRLSDFMASIGIEDEKIDTSIYSSGRLMRIAGSRHVKSGLYCMPIVAVNADGTLAETIEQITERAGNKNKVEEVLSSPLLEQHHLTANVWTKPLSMGPKAKTATAIPSAEDKPKRKKIRNCELLNVLLSNPDKMKEHWKNGNGKYFSDLMQVLPMAYDVESVDSLQERIEAIMSEVRPDVHKESPSYYAGKEPNCSGLKSVCSAMGVPCAACDTCQSRIPDIAGLEIGRDPQNRPTIVKNISNVTLLIAHEYPGMLKRNIAKMRNMFGDRPLTDGDRLEIYARISSAYKGFAKELVNDGIDLLLSRNEYDPMLDLVNSAKHDGVGRLDKILIDLCGAEDNEYNRAVSRYIGVAMVSRTMNPGAKADIVPILYSPVQGSGKSSFCEKLSIIPSEYHTILGSTADFHGQRTIERITGAWVVEFSEMTAMQKASTEEELKGFVTNRYDKYRPAYGREVKEIGRRCVFIGTTNKNVILKDETGSRRWWIVRVADDCPHKTMPDDVVRDYILQFFAEAKIAVEAGEAPDIKNATVLSEHKNVVEESTEIDEWEGLIIRWLDSNNKRHTCNFEVWDSLFSNINAGKRDEMQYVHKIRIGKIFHRLGWGQRSMRTDKYGKQRCYVAPEIARDTTLDNIIKMTGGEITDIKAEVTPDASQFESAFKIE